MLIGREIYNINGYKLIKLFDTIQIYECITDMTISCYDGKNALKNALKEFKEKAKIKLVGQERNYILNIIKYNYKELYKNKIKLNNAILKNNSNDIELYTYNEMDIKRELQLLQNEL